MPREPPRRLLSKGSDRSTFRIFFLSFFFYLPSLVFFQLVLVEEEGADNFDYERKGKKVQLSIPNWVNDIVQSKVVCNEM